MFIVDNEGNLTFLHLELKLHQNSIRTRRFKCSQRIKFPNTLQSKEPPLRVNEAYNYLRLTESFPADLAPL